MQVRGKRDGVPVSLLPHRISCFKFANWPNSAGMEPGVDKTHSNHTPNKSHYPTDRIGQTIKQHKSRGKREDRVPVITLSDKFSHTVKTYNKQVTLSD
jgi:hypothetical protein